MREHDERTPGVTNERLQKRLSAITAPRPPSFPAPPPPNPRHRRAEVREATYRFARIVVGRQAILQCIVKDMSSSGARVALEGATELPDEVILVIDQCGRRFRARVAWRAETEAGLCFTGEIVRTRNEAAKAPDAPS